MKTDIEQSLGALSSACQDKIALLCTIPGVDTISAISIISEIGIDMPQFGSAGQFLSWVGVVPQNKEPAGKKRTTRIAKGNQYLKPVPVQCANAATRDKSHPEIRDKHMATRKRRGFKKAITATAKRIATCAYFMLPRNEEHNPPKHMEMPPQTKARLTWTSS
ncbi:MAG: transposase [Eubacteriaceae bacterium]|nr:transposase [Eubacteriaceae bacterium]